MIFVLAAELSVVMCPHDQRSCGDSDSDHTAGDREGTHAPEQNHTKHHRK